LSQCHPTFLIYISTLNVILFASRFFSSLSTKML
jgi:hypothetical protein